MRRHGQLGILIGMLLGASAPAGWSEPSFTITDLGAFTNSYSEARAINAAGHVVGAYRESSSSDFRAFLYRDGVWTNLGLLPGGWESFAYGLNNNGQVVGSALNSGGYVHAFLWDSTNGMQDLGTLGGLYSHGRGINDSGQVAGYSETSPGSFLERAFLWSGGAMTNLGLLPSGGNASAGYAINALGHVAGHAIPSSGSFHGFLWNGVAMTDIGALAGDYTEAYGINNSDQITGMSTINIGSPGHAFRWSSTNGIQSIGTLPGATFCYGKGINSAGHIVGHADGAAAFYYDGTTLTNLNSLIPTNSGWNLLSAEGINDAGQIIGRGISPGGQPHAFLLTPLIPGDTDSDGLPDWWETLHFGGPTNASPNALAANGENSISEMYVADLDPTNPASLFLVAMTTQMVSGSFGLLIESSSTGRIYDVHRSTNLMTGVWSSLGLQQSGTGSNLVISVTNLESVTSLRSSVGLP